MTDESYRKAHDALDYLIGCTPEIQIHPIVSNEQIVYQDEGTLEYVKHTAIINIDKNQLWNVCCNVVDGHVWNCRYGNITFVLSENDFIGYFGKVNIFTETALEL